MKTVSFSVSQADIREVIDTIAKTAQANIIVTTAEAKIVRKAR